MERKVNIITDIDGNRIVMINDMKFKGKRKVNWEDVESYLKRYVGEFYSIAATGKLFILGLIYKMNIPAPIILPD